MPVFQNREAARRYARVVLEDSGRFDDAATDDEKEEAIEDYATSVRPGWFGNRPFDGDTCICRPYVQGPQPRVVPAEAGVISALEVDLCRPCMYWRTEPLEADAEHIVPYRGGRAVIWADRFDTSDGPVYKLEIVRLELPVPFAEQIAEPPSVLDEERYRHIYDVVLDGDFVIMRGRLYSEAVRTADFLAVRRGGMEYPLVTGDILAVRNAETGAIHHSVGVGAPREYVVQVASEDEDQYSGPVLRFLTPDPLHQGEWISYYSHWSRRWPGPRYTGDPRTLGNVVYSCRGVTIVDSIGKPLTETDISNITALLHSRL